MSVSEKKDFFPNDIILDRLIGFFKEEAPILGGIDTAPIDVLAFFLKTEINQN